MPDINIFKFDLSAIKYEFDIGGKFVSKEIKSYEYLDYSKHVTLYPDGRGIIIHTYEILTKDKCGCSEIFRKLDLSDAAKAFKFPRLEKLKSTDLKNRFTHDGFWYESDNNFITSAEERYWSDSNFHEEDKSLDTDKHLRWVYKVNTGKIENGKTYKFNDFFSFKDMFPITGGVVDKAKLPYEPYEFSSCCTYNCKVKNMTYIISFERDIKASSLTCEYTANGLSYPKTIETEKENNYIYQKYIAKYKNLRYNNNIKISWDIQE
ncbi:MAG TPA: hypothetical protein DEQ02_02160 [Ruminococcaceae bacterium]|nr:hypothetical protein [Oscillospiraceae bacterium]